MRNLLFYLMMPVVAAGAEIPRLVAPEFLDAEVSTNIPFAVEVR